MCKLCCKISSPLLQPFFHNQIYCLGGAQPPYGIGLSPRHKMLYLNERFSPWVWFKNFGKFNQRSTKCFLGKKLQLLVYVQPTIASLIFTKANVHRLTSGLFYENSTELDWLPLVWYSVVTIDSHTEMYKMKRPYYKRRTLEADYQKRFTNATSVVCRYCTPYMVINYDVKLFNVKMDSAVTQLLRSRVTTDDKLIDFPAMPHVPPLQ